MTTPVDADQPTIADDVHAQTGINDDPTFVQDLGDMNQSTIVADGDANTFVDGDSIGDGFDSNDMDQILDQLGMGNTARLTKSHRREEDESGAGDPELIEDATKSWLAQEKPQGKAKLFVAGGDLRRPKKPKAPEQTLLVLLRPRLVSRILLVVCLVLLCVMVVLAGMMARHMGTLIQELRGEVLDTGLVIAQQPLPADAELVLEHRFHYWLLQYPERQPELYLRRAELLGAEGDWFGASQHYEQARNLSVHGLLLSRRLDYAYALIQAGHQREADALLEQIDMPSLSEEERAEVIAFIGKMSSIQAQ